MKWIIEKINNFEDLTGLTQEIEKQNHEIEYLELLGDLKNKTNTSKPTLFYGSLNTAERIRRETLWQPGIYCNLSAFQCNYYCPRIGDELINYRYILLPYGDLIRRAHWLFQQIGENDHIFIKPNSGNKIFTGMLVEWKNWEKDIGYLNLDPECTILVAPPINLVAEWRFIVVDGKILTGSQYKPEKTLCTDHNIIMYAQKILDQSNYKPDRVWCLDLALTKSGRLGVLETNSFSSAGLYNCDVGLIVKEVSKIAEEDWKEYNAN